MAANPIDHDNRRARRRLAGQTSTSEDDHPIGHYRNFSQYVALLTSRGNLAGINPQLITSEVYSGSGSETLFDRLRRNYPVQSWSRSRSTASRIPQSPGVKSGTGWVIMPADRRPQSCSRGGGRQKFIGYSRWQTVQDNQQQLAPPSARSRSTSLEIAEQ